MRRRDLKASVVVITGASSGIGRATALAFAQRGARVVLAARREEVLQQVARECERLGGQSLVVPTDVTSGTAMVRLASAAADKFGERIDVWINNAGVGAIGEFSEVPMETHDQVIRTNLMGYMHGAHAVLPYFKRQGSGTLINTISLGGWVPSPYATAYSASKFGLRGFSEALRAELTGYPEIHVCDVFPAFIDTPGFRHSANYAGGELKPVPPVYAPERVARAMVSLAERPRNAVTVGAAAHVARFAHFVLGGLSGRVMRYFLEAYFARARPVPTGDGSLFEPDSSHARAPSDGRAAN
jgi:short-subunit dehydrogenase